jgi:opacity protein-like surface antigen
MRWTLTPFLCTCLAVAATSAQAQEARPERPYRGLFAADAYEDLSQRVQISGSVGGGYDTDLVEEARDASIIDSGSRLQRSGTLGQFSGSASYALNTEGANLSVSGGSTGRYYPSAEERSIVHRENLSASGAARVGAGLTFNGTAAYQPFTTAALYGAFLTPELGEPTNDFDFISSREHYVSYSTGLSWAHQISRRTGLNANYRYSGRLASTEIPGYGSYEAGGGLTHNLSDGLALKFGYRYHEASYASDEPYRTHHINAGVDFEKALSFSRRTTVSFSTGTAASDDPTTAGGLVFRAIGDASLTHEIGRTWLAAATYNRNLRFSADFLQPIASDSVGVTLSGLVNRRFRVHARAGMSTGRVIKADEGDFDNYFADTGVNFALGRHTSFGASYRYNEHDYKQSGIDLAFGVPRAMQRHSVQVYMSASTLVFQRARTP